MPRKAKFKPAYCVWVLWEDAHHQYGETDPHKPHAPYMKQTCGVLVREDFRGISIAMEYNEDGTVQETTFVPKNMVARIRRWKIPG